MIFPPSYGCGSIHGHANGAGAGYGSLHAYGFGVQRISNPGYGIDGFTPYCGGCGNTDFRSFGYHFHSLIL